MPILKMIPHWRGATTVCAMARVLTALLVSVTLAGLPQFLFVAPALAADEPTSITQAQLWVYPEYDDPRLLVMLEGTIPQGTKLPVQVRFLVPTGAEMYSAGSKDNKGNYKGGPPDRKPSDIAGWDEISYSLTTNIFRVEYYDDAIKGLPEKTIAYEFRTLYPIGTLEVSILQPAKATNFNLTPVNQSKRVVESMNSFDYRYSSIGVDKPLSFNVSYTKADAVPSIKPVQGGAVSQGPNSSLYWFLGIGGAAVAALGAYWYTSKQRRYRPAAYRGARPAQRASMPQRSAAGRTPVYQASERSSRAERAAPKVAEKGSFCRKCGTKLEGPAAFCRRCGTRVG